MVEVASASTMHSIFFRQPLMASHKPDPQVRNNIRHLVESIHELKEWPLLDLLLSRGGEADWILPLHVARAFNASDDRLWHAVTALACLHIGIVMVDDILDDTPNDAIRDFGTGKVANASQALQAMASRVISKADLSDSAKLRALNEVAEIGFGTAFGQSLDAAGSRSEESHWKALLNKSTPFYAGALRLGGYFSGASDAQLKALGDFVNNASNGVVLFSLGFTGYNPEAMPKEVIRAFVKAFEKLQQRVVMRFDPDYFEEWPENVFVSNWIPQQDVLGN